MVSLSLVAPFAAAPNFNSSPCSKIRRSFRIGSAILRFPVSSRPGSSLSGHLLLLSPRGRVSLSNSSPSGEEEDLEGLVQDLRVPEHWSNPSKALEESEWLRITLHKWLDDEYCPEATNVEISNVASRSYYRCLVENQADVGEILLKMARELESISYQESFHGAFSSANAAINLIIQRIEQSSGST